MSDSDKLITLLKQKAKLVAMIAPSFPIMYDPKTIVSKLKSIGFTYVVEVAVGAKETNRQAVSILKNNPHTRFITSPCSSFVRYMRTKHPDLLHYVAFEVDSPMVATAGIVKKKWPEHQPVFIGPCLLKKLESSQDRPDLNILVLTYRELDQVFSHFSNESNKTYETYSSFDLSESSTRIYPIDGGLTDSSGARNLLKEDEIRVVSGVKNMEAALTEFEQNKKIRLLDVLFCEGGCIMGPGIASNLKIQERKDKITAYAHS
ncbi:hypothetical protein HZA76_00715 [Candidatus Roizmanbacteria bacterium]|nr:hypothetical protein [Candidatus Roizmanbacteria bacterium]